MRHAPLCRSAFSSELKSPVLTRSVSGETKRLWKFYRGCRHQCAPFQNAKVSVYVALPEHKRPGKISAGKPAALQRGPDASLARPRRAPPPMHLEILEPDRTGNTLGPPLAASLRKPHSAHLRGTSPAPPREGGRCVGRCIAGNARAGRRLAIG